MPAKQLVLIVLMRAALCFFCIKFLLGHQMKAVNAIFAQEVLTVFATGCSNTFPLPAGSLNYISIGS